jgi:hypothetical protein
MTQWTFSTRPNDTVTISKKEGDRSDLLLGAAEHIHIALTEVAPFFKPGDIVITPQGSCIVADLLGS